MRRVVVVVAMAVLMVPAVAGGQAIEEALYMMRGGSIGPDTPIQVPGPPPFQIGYREYSGGRYDQAVAYFKESIRLRPDFVSAYYYLGLSYQELGMLDEAIDALQRCIKVREDSPDAYYALGRIYADKGEIDKATNAFGRAGELNPQKYGGALRNLGDTSLKEGKYDVALAVYQSLVKAHPSDPELRYNLGRAYHEKGRTDPLLLDNAISEYKKAIELKPKYTDAMFNLGLVYMLKGAYEDSIRQFKDLVPISPKDPDVYFNLGNAMIQLAKTKKDPEKKSLYEEGIGIYKKALELDRKHTGASVNLALALMDLKREQEALPILRDAARYNPNSADVRFVLGLGYLKRGYVKDAIRELEKAVELKPDHVDAYKNLSTAYMRAGMMDKANEALRKAQELAPATPAVHHNAGYSYLQKAIKLKKGESVELAPDDPKTPEELLNKAISEFRKAVEMKPDFKEAYGNLGLAYLEKKMYDEAIAQFSKVIELDPSNFLAYANKGFAARMKGDIDEAIRSYEKAAEIKPEEYKYFFNLGELYYEKSKRDQANSISYLEKSIAAFERASRMRPTDDKIFYNLGVLYYELGDRYRGKDENKKKELWMKAVTAWEKSLKLNPAQARLRTNLNQLKQILGIAVGPLGGPTP